MIVESNNKMVEQSQVPVESPPSYDLATSSRNVSSDADFPSGPHPSPAFPLAKDSKSMHYSTQPQQSLPICPFEGPSMPPTTVYHYTNPNTQEHVTSLLPPDHPEMICLQAGIHIPETKFGILGIMAAILWFPFGVGLCLLDRKVRCQRCGLILEDGVCG